MTSGRDYSLGRRWTPVADVVAAAHERRIFLMVWSPDNFAEHREVLVATGGPDIVWAVRRRREQHGGWVAVRVAAPDGEDLPENLLRLGPADARGSQVVGALVDAEHRRPHSTRPG